MAEATEFASADRFRNRHRGWAYRIPFSPVVHPQHGRIMVGIEPAMEGAAIRQLYVWFDHHDIEELQQPIAIPTPQAVEATGISTFNFRTRDAASFFEGCWLVVPCKDHPGGLIFLSYPPDDASALIVDTLSSTISVHYEVRVPTEEGLVQ